MTTTLPLSRLVQRPTEVTSLVAEQDVILDRRNADDLYLSTRARHEADAQVLGIVVGALAALARTRPDLAGDVLTETLPWMAWLPLADRTACLVELLEDLRAGTSTGHLRRFHADLAAWRSTAITWSDPAVLAELQRDHDGDGMSEAESLVTEVTP